MKLLTCVVSPPTPTISAPPPPPQQTRPTWLQTWLGCGTPCLIIQGQGLGSGSAVELTPQKPCWDLSFPLIYFVPFSLLPLMDVSPFCLKSSTPPPPPPSSALSPLCCSFLPSPSSLLNPPLLGHFLSIFQIPLLTSNIKTLTAFYAAACSSTNLNRFSLTTV